MTEILGTECHYTFDVQKIWNYLNIHLYLNEDNVTEKDLLEVRLNRLTETERNDCSREETDLK